MLAPSIEEMREVYLQVASQLTAAGTQGLTIAQLNKPLDAQPISLRKVLEVSMALELIVGYGQTLGRRYVLTWRGAFVATTLREHATLYTIDTARIESALTDALKSLR